MAQSSDSSVTAPKPGIRRSFEDQRSFGKLHAEVKHLRAEAAETRTKLRRSDASLDLATAEVYRLRDDLEACQRLLRQAGLL